MTLTEIARGNNYFQFRRPWHRGYMTFIFSSMSRELQQIPDGWKPSQAVTARILAIDVAADDWEYVR